MDWLQLFILAALGTGLSVAAQGFLFAYRNNIYHIPVVLKLFDSAQFASDPFYQSLRNFTSLVWPGLSLITTPANIGAVFLGAHLASRILLYVTCLVFLYQAGLRKTPQLAIAVLTLAFSRAFVDYSAVGATGMQIDYFTHTELTYPLILASLMLAANRYYLLAFAVNGLTWNVNAFTGAWLAIVLPLVALENVKDLAAAIRRIALGTAAQLLVAAPTLLWIWKALAASRGIPNFPYRSFLQIFYPKHFLIAASNSGEILEFVMMCVSGGLALRYLGSALRPYAVAFYGLIAVFCGGVLLPFLSDSRMLLNLHLLRIDGVLTLCSLLFVILTSLGIAAQDPANADAARAFVVLATLAIGDWRLTAIALALLLDDVLISRWISRQVAAACFAGAVFLIAATEDGLPPWSQSECLVVGAICLALSIVRRDVALGALALVVAGLNWPMLSVVAGVSMGLAILEKERAIDWAAGIALAGALVQIGLHHTDRKAALSAALLVVGAVVLFWEQRRPNGISVASLRAPRFAAALLLGALLWCAGQRAALAWKRDPVLIAWRDVQEWARLHTPPDAEFLVPPEQNGFELGSYRRAWVDHQQGAAVLWSPSFYAQWISRYPAVAALKNHAQFYSYARAHAIRYYVLQREQSRDGTVCPQETRLYENGEFEVYQLNPAEPHEQRRIILGDGACSE